MSYNLSKYFSVTVKPTIAASLAHADAALTANDVVFDWTSFKVPGGGNRLVGVTVIAPPTNGGVSQDFPLDLMFATQTRGNGGVAGGAAPQSIGTISSAAIPLASPYYEELVGAIKIDATDYTDTEPRSIGVTGVAQGGMNPVLFETYDNDSIPPVDGMYTFYVAATTPGTPSLQSGIDLTEALDAAEKATITVDGVTAVTLSPGDVLHAQDNAVVGTVSSITNGTTIVLTAANTAALANNDILYNINPIKLILSFERY
jgi:hypothetical protein|tara:strand:+ start:29 stop:805 length:777 start_codon:yes stop_codon:yes gene_type:complete